MKHKIITVYGDAKDHYLTKEIKDYLVKNGFIVCCYDFYDLNYCEKLTDSEVKTVEEVFEAKISLCDYFLFVNTSEPIRSKRSNDMINKAWGYKKPVIYFHENCDSDIYQIIPYISSIYDLEESEEEFSTSDSKEDKIYRKIIKEMDELKTMVDDLKNISKKG